MVKRVYDAILQQFQDELADYKHLEAPTEYDVISTHGDADYEEFARYVFKKQRSRPTGSETTIGGMCDKLTESLRARPEVERTKVVYGDTITIEVYTEYSGNE